MMSVKETMMKEHLEKKGLTVTGVIRNPKGETSFVVWDGKKRYTLVYVGLQ